MVEHPMSLQDLIRRRQAGGFVGRQEELGLFQENLRLAVEDPRRRFLFCIRGDAGVGKSFLLRQFIRLTRERGYATAYVDESVFDIPTVMDTLAADLARQDKPCKDFTKRSEAYRKHRHELDADPAAPDGLSSALTRSAVRIGLRTAEDIPLVGPFAKELNTDAVAAQADQLRSFLSRKFRNQHDVRLMLAPVDELTPTFVNDLRAIASHQPVALFFDTYERTGTFLDPWLLDLLAGRYGDLPSELVLTIAGQHPLNIHTWGDYLGMRADLALQVFTDTEARELLATRGVTDNSVVEVILGLTGRLPVLVAMLAESQPDTVEKVSDPSDNAVERFLKWEKDEQRRMAAQHGALPRRLDRDIYAAATGSTSADEDFAWLRGLPFVTEHTDGYRYHDIVRDTMLRKQRRLSPADWQQRHTTLADHYHAARDSLGLEARAAWRDNQWQGLAVEEHYHRLCAHPATALPAALAALIDVIDNQPDSAARWTTMIRQAGQDTNTSVINDRVEKLCTSSADQDNDRILLLTHLITEPTLDDHHRAIAYCERGNIHLKHNQHEDALTDLTRAIELDPIHKWAIAGRGWTYQRMGRYDDALTDLTRAIELDPDDGFDHYRIGLIALAQGRADAAHDHISKAIEVERSGIAEFPRDGWRALHIAVYLLAMGEARQAERQIRETLKQTINAVDVRDAINDLQELHAVRQCDIVDAVGLLRSHLSGD
ncbi:MAG: tetratricopeptide repeat protein [Sciscionella sp.]